MVDGGEWRIASGAERADASPRQASQRRAGSPGVTDRERGLLDDAPMSENRRRWLDLIYAIGLAIVSVAAVSRIVWN